MTSWTVTLPEGVIHGTPEGHKAGCKGNMICPAAFEHGMTCTNAYVRQTTTPARYVHAYARDPRPHAIAQALGYLAKPRPQPGPSEPLHTDEPAQSLAEQLHDPSPDTTNTLTEDPVDVPEAAAEAPGTGPAEGEGMGHLTLAALTQGMTSAARHAKGREIRAWLRAHGHPALSHKGIIPSAALAQYAAAHQEQPDDDELDEHAAVMAAEAVIEYGLVEADPDTFPGNDGNRVSEDPTHGRIDKDIQEAVDQLNPATIGQRIAIESTLQEQRDQIANLDIAHRSDLLDETRARIDEPVPSEPPAPASTSQSPANHPRPEWAEVTVSEDVEAAREEAREANALAERHQLQAMRAWWQAAHLECELVEAERRTGIALDLALRAWDKERQRVLVLEQDNAALTATVATLHAEIAARPAPWWRRILGLSSPLGDSSKGDTA